MVVYYQLLVQIETENLSQIKFDVSSLVWVLKVSCSFCKEGTVAAKEIYVNPQEQHNVPGSRGKTNSVFKCPLCERYCYIGIEDKYCRFYSCSDTQKQSLILFSFNNCKPLSWKIPSEGFTCIDINYKEYDIVFDEDYEWSDYNDASNTSLGVYKIEHEFKSVKRKDLKKVYLY